MRFILMLILMVIFPSVTHAQDNPLGQLSQYISDLQKNPADIALREKIIKHVQTMSPAPAIPLEAERYEGRAEFAIKNAKSEADFLDAAKEYGKALLIAPWVPAYYFNQGIAYEKGGNLKEAKQSFEFYLLAALNAQDAKEVRKRIAGLEYAMEKAAKESSQAVITEKKQNTFEDLLKKIESRRFTRTVLGDDGGKWIMVLDVKNSSIVSSIINPQGIFGKDEIPVVNIQGLESSITFRSPATGENETHTFLINEKGDKITHRKRFSDGEVREYIYRWQR